MPYKSEAQRGKFHAMLKRGQISASTVKEFDEASKGMKLPARVKKKDKSHWSNVLKGGMTGKHCHANGTCHNHPNDGKGYG